MGNVTLKSDIDADFWLGCRFDCIFIVKDEHDERRDITLAKHVMNVHMNAHIREEASAERQEEF